MFATRAHSCMALTVLMVGVALGTRYGAAREHGADSSGQQPNSQRSSDTAIERVRGCSTPASERKTVG